MPAVLRGRTIVLIAVAAVLVIFLYLIFRYVPLSTLRDLAIIMIALLNVVLLVFLVLIAFALWRLVELLRGQVPSVISSVQRTATTVEGTADFVSTTAATPLIRGVSLLYAVTRALQVLLGRRRRAEE
jgi:hypothetical protein